MGAANAARFSNPIDETLVGISLRDFRGRPNHWSRAVWIMEEHPFFGTGLNTYDRAIHKYPPSGPTGGYPYAHNSYLQLGAEMGALGLAAFLFLLYQLVAALVRGVKAGADSHPGLGALHSGLAAGLIGFLVKAFLDTEFHSMQRVSLFWFLSGLAIALSKIFQEDAASINQRVL